MLPQVIGKAAGVVSALAILQGSRQHLECEHSQRAHTVSVKARMMQQEALRAGKGRNYSKNA